MQNLKMLYLEGEKRGMGKNIKLLVMSAVFAFLILYAGNEILMPQLYQEQEVKIFALGEKNEASASYEIWIHTILVNGRKIALDQLELTGAWQYIEGRLFSNTGNMQNVLRIQIPKMRFFQIEFGRQQSSGMVEVVSGNDSKRLDLYSQEEDIGKIAIAGERHLSGRAYALWFLLLYITLLLSVYILLSWRRADWGFLKKIRKAVYDGLDGQMLNTALLGMYLLGIWSAYLYINYAEILEMQTVTIVLAAKLLFIASVFFVSSKLIRLIGKIRIRDYQMISRRKKVITFLCFAMVSFTVFFLWYIAFYPGGFSNDSIAQYTEAVSGKYNDWHPAWHTLLTFTIPWKITNSVSSILLFQLICMSLALAYVAMTIYEYGGVRFAAAALGCILLNPIVTSTAMYPWKDVTFAIAAALAVNGMVKIYFAHCCGVVLKGKWILIISFFLANAALMRHNAILFTAAAIIALAFYLQKGQWFFLTASCLLMILVVKGPLYSAAGVEKPGLRKQEMMGLPLCILANVTKECPQLLDENIADFMYAMAPQEKWEETYVCGDFNSIKWIIDLSVIEDTDIGQILKMMVRCFVIAPRPAWKAFLSLTDLVYSMEGDIAYIGPKISQNEVDIVYKGNEELRALLAEGYVPVVLKTIFKYLCYIGTPIFVMLAVICAKTDFSNRKDWKRMMLCMPVFVYDAGTMLLLTGPDARFFYVNFLVCPLIVLMVLRDGNG